jgi:glyoxylase-like metal-dependent hydrolase (beta-lactamase superfamily II)
VHIQRPGVSLLVDACTPTAFLGTEYELAGVELYPGLDQQLKSVGAMPEEVTHVVLTHAHFDHVIGVTTLQGEQFVPCFPNARHYLGRADWEDPQMQADRNEPGAFENKTLAVLQRYGLLTLVDGDQELMPGITLLHVPGETPGHQILQLTAGERTLYCLGDLYHDAVEVEQPTWMTSWSDPTTLLTSRQRFSQRALVEQALLIAAHIPTIGVLRATDDGVRWEDSGQ